MSDNYLRFIPLAPGYVPEASAQERARDLLHTYTPRADEVRAQVWEHVQFVDCGSNLERVLCPACHADLLDDGRWGRMMDAAYEVLFTSLVIPMPCCGVRLSLNDLEYELPVGFARFMLEAWNPGIPNLEREQVHALEQTLGCQLRTIWAHY